VLPSQTTELRFGSLLTLMTPFPSSLLVKKNTFSKLISFHEASFFYIRSGATGRVQSVPIQSTQQQVVTLVALYTTFLARQCRDLDILIKAFCHGLSILQRMLRSRITITIIRSVEASSFDGGMVRKRTMPLNEPSYIKLLCLNAITK
jgi:hypothetical protein